MTSNSGRGGRKGRGRGRSRGGGRCQPSIPHHSTPLLDDDNDMSDPPSTEVSADGRGGSRGGGHCQSSVPHHSTPPLDNDNDMSDPPSPEVSADDVMVDDGGVTGVNSSSRKKELIPGALWFTKSDVVRVVTNSIKKNYNDPWRNWTETPNETKDLWFGYFKRFFTWRPELEGEVRACYDERAGKRLKDMAHKAAQKKPEEKPNWLLAKVHDELLKRKEEEDFKKRSEQARKNKRGGSDKKLVHPGHCQGSISTVEVADRLENYNQKMAEYKQKGINKDPNEVFWEVVGGRKKGQVRGLGSGVGIFYDRSNSRSCKSTESYTPSLISHLSAQVQEAKRKAEENSQASEQQRELHDKQIAEFERQRVEFERQRAELEKERVQLERERIQTEREKVNEQKRLNEYLLEMQKSQKQMNEFFLLFASKTLQPEPQPHSLSQQQLKVNEVGQREKPSESGLAPGLSRTWKNKKRRRE